MGGHGRAAIQLWLNFLGQLLPQLHSVRGRVEEEDEPHSRDDPKAQGGFLSNSPPLVEAVDVPDDALNEDLVLIHGCRGKQQTVPMRAPACPTPSPLPTPDPLSFPIQ